MPGEAPRIGLYAGTGTSHSWLWFVELFDRMLLHDVVILNEDMVRLGVLESLDVFAMSGGDTIGIAQHLGSEGARALGAFIGKGGLYIGSCAGAYLPMRSSKQHLNLFNFANIKIANVSKVRPQTRQQTTKAFTSYGCDYVYHPVREDVRLRLTNQTAVLTCDTFLAPLYGGPSMIVEDTSEILAYYDGFTQKTKFLVDRDLAEDTLIGKVAAARLQMGDGRLYLFGPHFEHPNFPMANAFIAAILSSDVCNGPHQGDIKRNGMVNVEGEVKYRFIEEIRREISNSRIVSIGLEPTNLEWTIGHKIYQPEKIRVFLESIWKRIGTLERLHRLCIKYGADVHLVKLARRVKELLRETKQRIDQARDTEDIGVEIFSSLRELATLFLQIYFDSVRFNNQPFPYYGSAAHAPLCVREFV
ncbi:MAG: BPL-N domain-containing protein [Desulfomonilaceae bacterium]